ncbi:MAG: hypothetical protein WD646_13005 [Actinomycetota bacterium]
MSAWTRTYRIPFTLALAFVALLLVFAVTPDPGSGREEQAEQTAEPTSGPSECVVCGIDETCDPDTGQCIFVDHTPLPCVESAKMDERAGFCLPEGAPPAPTVDPSTIGGFPGGVGGNSRARQPRLPGFGD